MWYITTGFIGNRFAGSIFVRLFPFLLRKWRENGINNWKKNQRNEISSRIITGTTCRRFVIIPELSEPPVRTLGATIPENESHIFR